MKKLLPNILLASVFLIGLALLLYPAISNYVNTRHQSHAVASYEKDVLKLKPEDYTPILQAAQDYNTTLLDNPDRFLQTDEEAAVYQALLNPTNSGIMGYVEISKIGVKLPSIMGRTRASCRLARVMLRERRCPLAAREPTAQSPDIADCRRPCSLRIWTSLWLAIRLPSTCWIRC